ncbi:MAG: hypothetical protein NTW14_12170 [bacterium]|nr:hypothetical protein [bacterium]
MVLVLILVGVAIMAAVSAFNENLASANLDRVSVNLCDLGMRAQKYYRTPAWLSGGGNSFSGLTATAQGMTILTNRPINDDGAFSILTAGNDTRVTLQGVGVTDGDKDGQNVTMTLDVYPDSMVAAIISR